MIAELGQGRDEAERRAHDVGDLLGDVEALHEPDADGDCPACVTPGPCMTMLLIRRAITVDQAFAAMRNAHVIDLTRTEREAPPVPSLSQLLAQPPRGMDRFFDALLGLPDPAERDVTTQAVPVPEGKGSARAS
jgi:hypothetical protein